MRAATYKRQLARWQHLVHVLLPIADDAKILGSAHGDQIVNKRTELDLEMWQSVASDKKKQHERTKQSQQAHELHAASTACVVPSSHAAR